ncbi:MAG: hypothetical protein ACR2P5_03750 [Gammaproteobacteria bacterium]
MRAEFGGIWEFKDFLPVADGGRCLAREFCVKTAFFWGAVLPLRKNLV